MLVLIAWRNVWRNKKRSLIILTAVAFGVWAGVFSMGFTKGMYAQMVDSGVSTRIGHLQVHAPGFRERPDVEKTIPDATLVLERSRSFAQVRGVSGRVVMSGMASSPQTATGVKVLGIDPAEDALVFDVSERLVEGSWFGDDRRNRVVIGAKLAERLEISLGRKIVLQAEAADGSIGGGAFRVVGIYKTPMSAFDETTVFALRQDVQRIFGLGESLHQIAIRLDDSAHIDAVGKALQEACPDLVVETWQDVSPELAITTEMGDQMLYVFLILILLGLVFGITNTMLMGVLERIRELGVLTALGMKGSRLFGMILVETVLLSMAGGSIGILSGMGTIAFFGKRGIDLSIVSEGLSAFGMDTVVYPALPWGVYVDVTALVVATALIAAVYPGVKAIRLNTVQAIRTY